MRFSVEIYKSVNDDPGALLHRTTITAITPLAARKQAHHLLALWKKRGAQSASVLNEQVEVLYRLNE